MPSITASFEQYRDGLWVHFSKLPQLTINPKQFHQDPAGLYLFPESFATEGAWHRYPYRIICRLKPGLEVLDIRNVTRDDIMDFLEAFGFQDMKQDEYLSEERELPAIRDRFWDIIRQRFMGEPGRFNKAWRRQGFDAIFDDTGVIHNSETQLIVLNPRFVEVVKVEEQKGSGFDEINRVLEFMAKKYGQLGEVKINKPAQSKQWGEKQLQGSIEIRKGDQYATFQVNPWFVDKKDQIPEAISVILSSDSKGLKSQRSWGVSLKFRDFDKELIRLTDPKEDVAHVLRQVFGDDTLSALFPITSPMGVDFADSSDAYIGPPFGGMTWDTHPMYEDPEMFLHAPSQPVQRFMKDLVPLLSAFAGKPTVEYKDGEIEVELDGKGKASGTINSADGMGFWFEKDEDWMDENFQYDNFAILEHIEVEPKARREGAGTKIVEAFIKAAKKGGAQAVFLNASPFGAEGDRRLTVGQIVSFYKSLGFQTFEDQGTNQVMVLDLYKKAKADFTREDNYGFYPEGWHDNKQKDPGRLAHDFWAEDQQRSFNTPYEPAVTSDVFSAVPLEVRRALINWIEGSYDEDEATTIIQYNWPEKFRKVEGTIYRGEPLRDDDFERMNENKQTSFGISWTTNIKIAKQFAVQSDVQYGAIFKLTPMLDQVALNIDVAIKELELDVAYEESEILLKGTVNLTWDKVESIVYSEKSEQEGEPVPKEKWPTLYPTTTKVSSSDERKANRAEAKATLPEDSELMEFYNMADADAWGEEVREDAKAEWERMSEEQRKQEIPDVKSHTGWRELPDNPTTPEEWREILDGWLGMKESYAMDDNNNTSETFFNNAKIVSNPTLVRFTSYPGEAANGGTFEGHGPSALGLTAGPYGGNRPGDGDLAFAFNIKELKTRDDWKKAQGKYGKRIFKFKVPYAVEADHISDYERQTVFDVNTVKDLKEIQLPEASPTERIKEKLEEISRMSADDLMEAIDRYNEEKRPSKKIGDALEARRKVILKNLKAMQKYKEGLKKQEGV